MLAVSDAGVRLRIRGGSSVEVHQQHRDGALLMMVQALLSLLILAVPVSRAINALAAA